MDKSEDFLHTLGMAIKTWHSLLLLSLISLPSVATEVKWESPVPNNHHWQVGLGPGLVSGLNTPDLIASWRLGYGWNVVPDFEMALITDFGISSQRPDMHYFTVKIATDYNFSEADTAPFVTGDLGYASVHAHHDCADASCESPSDDAGGVSLGLGGGYKFFRHRTVQLGVLGRIDVMFASTGYGTPLKYSLQAIAYF